MNARQVSKLSPVADKLQPAVALALKQRKQGSESVETAFAISRNPDPDRPHPQEHMDTSRIHREAYT